METIQKKRIIWIDAFRGFLICLVVLGHVLQIGNFDDNRLWNFIYSFHMPAFFVISGFVSYKPFHDEKFYEKKVNGLLLPWFCWVLIFAVFSENFLEYVAMAVYRPDTSLWFLITLFYIACFQNLIDWLARRVGVSLFVLSAIAFVFLLLAYKTTDPWHFGLGWTLYHFPYYVIGQYARSVNFDLIPKKMLCISTAAFFILAFYWKRAGGPDVIYEMLGFGQEYITYFYKYACAVIGSLSLLYIFKILEVFFSRAQHNFLAYLGRISLGIYACHVPIMILFRDKVGEHNYLICFLLTVSTSVLVVFCLSKFKLSSRYLLGKK